MAALANGVMLLVAMGAIAWEALQCFWVPANVPGLALIAVAGAGILINGLTA